jgi:hypothetical protein
VRQAQLRSRLAESVPVGLRTDLEDAPRSRASPRSTSSELSLRALAADASAGQEALISAGHEASMWHKGSTARCDRGGYAAGQPLDQLLRWNSSWDKQRELLLRSDASTAGGFTKAWTLISLWHRKLVPRSP